MARFILLLATTLLLANTSHLYAQDKCSPVGWGAVGSNVTGGGSATPVLVTTYDGLKQQLTSSSAAVIYMQGEITIPPGGRITIQYPNKTLIGLPSSRLISTDYTANGSGIFYIKNCSNIILRNLTFEGPGAYDTDGYDHLCIDNVTYCWVDHCDFQDGVDGNFDIKNKSNYVSVTWCRFRYLKVPISGGSGGAADHRFTNLIGSSDDATADAGKLKTTFQYCWWDEGCVERMPRIRYGQIHLVNNLFSSTVAKYCIRAAYKADVYVDKNAFVSVKNPVTNNSSNEFHCTYLNNYTSGTSGSDTHNKIAALSGYSGEAQWNPYGTTGYVIDTIPASLVQAAVSSESCGAGATLTITGSAAATYAIACGGATSTTLAAPTAAFVRNDTQATISWNAIDSASGYKVKVCGNTKDSSVFWNFSSYSAVKITSSTTLSSDLSIVSSGKEVAIAAATGTGTYEGQTITKMCKFAGAGSTTDCALKLTLPGAGVLTVYSNAKDNNRILAVSDGTSVISDGTSTNTSVTTISAAGDYYIYSAGSGMEIYLLQFTTGGSSCVETPVAGTMYTANNLSTDESYSFYVQAIGNGENILTSEYALATETASGIGASVSLTSAATTTNQNVYVSKSITNIKYSYTGTASITWTGTGGSNVAPNGITTNNTDGYIIISGTPSATGNYSYTITVAAIGAGTPASANASGSLTVTDVPVNASITLASGSSASPSVQVGDALSISYSYEGTFNAISWTGSSATLPDGLAVSASVQNRVTISGTPTTIGTYSYLISINGLYGGSNTTASGTITVTAVPAPPVLSADATLSSLTTSPHGSLFPTFNADSTSYTMNVGNTIAAITIIAIANHDSATASGDGAKNLSVGSNPFTITVRAENGATKDYALTITRAAETVTSVESSRLAELKVYPNPAATEVTVEHEAWSSESKVEVYNIAEGVLVKVQGVAGTTTTVNVSGLPQGSYLIKLGKKKARFMKL
ncbi:MAG: T9SS type A sorting domain-containing protein [Prevotellaceae bacterium]|jgi:pectate lyase|nr:T9SS type A sorting domain-containing protein [Prevotellaceae bacterium]